MQLNSTRLNALFTSVRAIHVPIQGLLRTPKTPFQKGKKWLEIGASVSQASKLPLPFGTGTTNLSSDLKLTDAKPVILVQR